MKKLLSHVFMLTIVLGIGCRKTPPSRVTYRDEPFHERVQYKTIVDASDFPVGVDVATLTDMAAHPPRHVLAAASVSASTPGVFNIKTYGARGDGATNDDGAFQLAMNACGNAGGGTVYVPPGTYLFANPRGWATNGSGCTLQGAGQGVSILKYNIATGTTMLTSTLTTISDISIYDLTFEGPGPAVTFARPLDFDFVTNGWIERVSFDNWSYYAIFEQQSTNVHHDHLSFTNITSTGLIGGDAIHVFRGCSYLFFSNIYVNQVDGACLWINAGTTHGGGLPNDHVVVDNLTCINYGANGTGGVGLQGDGMTNSTWTNSTIGPAANPSTQQTYAMLIEENQNQIAATNNVVSNISVFNTGLDCFQVRSASGNRFSNINCHNPAMAATALGAAGYAVTFQDAGVIAGNTVFNTTDNEVDDLTIQVDAGSGAVLNYAVLWGGVVAFSQNNYVNNIHFVGSSSVPTTGYTNATANGPVTGANANWATINQGGVPGPLNGIANVANAVGARIGFATFNGNSTAHIAEVINGCTAGVCTAEDYWDRQGNYFGGSYTTSSGTVTAAALFASKQLREATVTVADADYATTGNEIQIAYSSIAAARTVTVSAGNWGATICSPAGPCFLTISDESGSASATNTITLTAAAGGTVDGLASEVVVNAPNGAMTLWTGGDKNWHTLRPSLASISSVSNSDGSLTISPTTGAVVASVNPNHANTWGAAQTHNAGDLLINNAGNTFATTFATNATAARTVTFPDATDTVAMLGTTNAFTGANTFPIGGSSSAAAPCLAVFSNATPVSSVTTGPTDGQVYTLPASAMSANGARVHIRASYLHAANTNNTTPELDFNGTAIASFTSNSSGNAPGFDAWVVRNGASTAWIDVIGHSTALYQNGGSVTGITYTGTITIKTRVTGATTNGDLTAEFMTVEFCSN